MNARAWLSLLALAGGCSLFDFAELALVPCGENKVCRELNDELGIDLASAPEVYQCAPEGQGCVLAPKDWDQDGVLSADVPGTHDEPRDCDDQNTSVAPGLAEQCDAIDNDCDGVIDEGVFTQGKARVGAKLGALSFADFSSASGSLARVDLTVIGANEAAAARPATRYELADNLLRDEQLVVSDGSAGEGASCPVVGIDGQAGHEPCAPVSIVTGGPSASINFAAAIDRAGREEGRVRIGHVEGRSLRVPEAPMPGECADGYPFVARDEHEGTSSEGVIGATRIELVQLPDIDRTARAQALTAWVGTHRLGHDACGKMAGTPGVSDDVDPQSRTRVGVLAMGFWLDQHKRLHTTGEGPASQPTYLGDTYGGGAPAMEPISLPDGAESYVVAVGAEEGPRLTDIPRFATPAAECADAEERSQLRARSAEPWHVGNGAHLGADHIALARGPVLENACGTRRVGARIGVSWLEGCGERAASVWFATVDYAPSTGFCHPSEPAELGRIDQRELARESAALAPVVMYVADGFTRDPVGGFLVAWVGAEGEAHLRRVDAVAGAPVDAKPLSLGVSGVVMLGARPAADGQAELLLIVKERQGSHSLVHKRVSGGCGN